LIEDIKFIPSIDWRKAEDLIKYEGMYVFGGLKPDGSVNKKLYLLAFVPRSKRSSEYKLEWIDCDDLDSPPQGKSPDGRFDHGMVKFRNNIVVFGGRRQT